MYTWFALTLFFCFDDQSITTGYLHLLVRYVVIVVCATRYTPVTQSRRTTHA